MNIGLNPALWLLLAFAAAAICVITVAMNFTNDESKPGVTAAIATAIPVILLIGVIIWIDIRSIYEISPLLVISAHTLLPLAAVLLGGGLAASWFIHGVRPRRHGGRNAAVSAIALVLAAAGMVITKSQDTLLILSVGTVLVIFVVYLLIASADVLLVRRTVFTAALVLMSSGGFLVYLMVFPEQIAAGDAQPEDGGASMTAASGLIVPGILVLAFLIGFMKSRRG